MSNSTMHLQPELIETLKQTIMQVVKDEHKQIEEIYDNKYKAWSKALSWSCKFDSYDTIIRQIRDNSDIERLLPSDLEVYNKCHPVIEQKKELCKAYGTNSNINHEHYENLKSKLKTKKKRINELLKKELFPIPAMSRFKVLKRLQHHLRGKLHFVERKLLE